MGIKNFFGRGYRTCNDEAEQFLGVLARTPAGAAVVRPWSTRTSMTDNSKLCALHAIAAGEFGLARKVGTSKYKCYYRRDWAGSWLAEVWGPIKASLVAAVLVRVSMPVVEVLAEKPSSHEHYEGAALAAFIVGLAICLCFLWRAALGFGIHYRVADTAGAFMQSAGAINLGMATYGVSLVAMSLLSGWSLTGLVAWTASGVGDFVGRFDFLSPVEYLGLAVGLSWHVIEVAALIYLAGFFFASVTFSWYMARGVNLQAGIICGMPQGVVERLYEGSFIRKAQESAHLQTVLGFMIYIFFMCIVISKTVGVVW